MEIMRIRTNKNNRICEFRCLRRIRVRAKMKIENTRFFYDDVYAYEREHKLNKFKQIRKINMRISMIQNANILL